MGNSFGNKPDLSLEQTADVAGTTLVEDYAAFGLTHTMAQSVALLAADFHAKLDAAKAQRNLAAQAVAAKDASRAALVEGLAQVCAVLYAPQSTVTDDQLRSIGFAPRRSGSPRPMVARRVANLVAVPDGIDGVTLTFDRALNPKTAIFQVFASADGGTNWTIAATSNRTQVTVPLAPGTPMWYRIVAQASGVPGAPSLPVSVYAPAPTAELRLIEGGKAA